jgi:hypothetical protein
MDTEKKLRLSTIFTGEVGIPESRFSKIGQGQMKLLGWNEGGNGLIFLPGSRTGGAELATKLRFRMGGREWQIARRKSSKRIIQK